MRRSTFLRLLGGGAAAAATGWPGWGARATAGVPSLQIPKTHPRLWWNAERLARARRWLKQNPFTPPPDKPLELALHYALTGEAASARKAIDWAMALKFGVAGVASDPARWEGENVILTYDWCNDRFTAAERAALIQRWNEYIETLNAKHWGGAGMEGNNYYIAYFRNALEWAVATFHENPRAPAILDHALTARWQAGLVPWAAGAGKGGVPHEGTQYGRGALPYFTVPLVTARLLGRDMWQETGYFRELLFYFIYSLTPGPTTRAGSNTRAYETFPFNEDEFWKDGESAASRGVGTFLAPLVEQWEGRPLAGFIQQYLQTTHAGLDRFATCVRKQVPARKFDSLPLDYYAPGMQFLYAKESWKPSTMLVKLQMGLPVGVGHDHHDAGAFQIWRGGRWLTRETVTYTETLAGWNNGPRQDGRLPIGHNVVLFNGLGMVDRRVGPPVVRRLESRPAYAFAAVDLTPAYRLRPDRNIREGNPHVQSVVREFVFIRPLHALVILDRMKATATGVVKSFLLHFETQPRVDGAGTVLATSGDQALRLFTLEPSRPVYRVVTEGGPTGQFRLEVDTTGPAVESHFLHVLAGRDASAPDLSVQLRQSADAFEVTLRHPTKGTAVVTLVKAMESRGGGFGFAAPGAPERPGAPFTSGVQPIQVRDDGPVWG